MKVAAFILMMAIFAGLFWLGMRSISKREQLPREPDPPAVARPPPVATGRRFAAVVVAFIEAIALAMLVLVVTDALGYRLDPRFGQAFVPWALVGIYRPDMILGPIERLWRRWRSGTT